MSEERHCGPSATVLTLASTAITKTNLLYVKPIHYIFLKPKEPPK
jgi:hypothetical protein